MQGIDVIILIIVAVLLLIALYGSIRHFKGEGPCCGGTSSRKSQEKQLMRPVIGRKSLRISGMHCENCADHVARALNTIEGVSANVSLKEGKATVSYDRKISDAQLRQAVEAAGYKQAGSPGRDGREGMRRGGNPFHAARAHQA